MKSEASEYVGIVRKLLDKTRQRRVEWTQVFSSSFECPLSAAQGPESFFFRVSSDAESGTVTLGMYDQGHNAIFTTLSNDLPTSPEEEQLSSMLEEIYDLARRQALKIEQKLDLASSLLDRV